MFGLYKKITQKESKERIRRFGHAMTLAEELGRVVDNVADIPRQEGAYKNGERIVRLQHEMISLARPYSYLCESILSKTKHHIEDERKPEERGFFNKMYRKRFAKKLPIESIERLIAYAESLIEWQGIDGVYELMKKFGYIIAQRRRELREKRKDRSLPNELLLDEFLDQRRKENGETREYVPTNADKTDTKAPGVSVVVNTIREIERLLYQINEAI